MAFASKCSLNIPFPTATDDSQHFENYKEIQRWADRLLREDEGCIGGDCCSEAFRFGITGEVFPTFTSGNLAPAFNLDRWFKTANVGLSGDNIEYPPGLWAFSFQAAVSITGATPPSSDHVLVRLTNGGPDGAFAQNSYASWPAASSINQMSASGLALLTEASTFQLSIINNTDVSVTVTGGQIMGAQFCDHCSVTYGS